LLRLGARHVVACDPYARINSSQDEILYTPEESFFILVDGEIQPNPEWIIREHKPVGTIMDQYKAEFDLILSSSVFEHIKDPEPTLHSLAVMTNPSGVHLHYIDLRDHYFRMPFEMLCYSEETWEKWLNPSSHLNRWRYWQYEELFSNTFDISKFDVLDRDRVRFEVAKARIRQEFLSGNRDIDSITRIRVVASNPAR
jgi:2-polyprenyl-3-methyl-5-hydroxy-6-metoxy-1,4-benzoquinol methylase